MSAITICMNPDYRIVQWSEHIFSIHLVFYDEAGNIDQISRNPCEPTSDSGQHLSNLLVRMLGAFEKPVLDGNLFADSAPADAATEALSFLQN